MLPDAEVTARKPKGKSNVEPAERLVEHPRARDLTARGRLGVAAPVEVGQELADLARRAVQ